MPKRAQRPKQQELPFLGSTTDPRSRGGANPNPFPAHRATGKTTRMAPRPGYRINPDPPEYAPLTDAEIDDPSLKDLPY